MHAEKDWILYAAYTDKTMERDALAYELWQEMGHYAPRWRYVELLILSNSEFRIPHEFNPVHSSTNSYRGVYVLMEKIKRGKHRLNIKQLHKEDAQEPE